MALLIKEGKLLDCLIVDDEKVLADTVCEYFNLYGIKAACCYCAKEALAVCEPISLALVDINMPDMDGYKLCEQLKQRNPSMRVFFVSARNDDFDIIKGYRIGGDDYITKPFSLSVLLEKVKKTLKSGNREYYRDLIVVKEERKVIVNGKEIEFKNMEFRLFYYLFANKNKVIDKSELLRQVWGDGYYTENTLNVHINRIREKLSDDPQKYIATVWGTGYRFD